MASDTVTIAGQVRCSGYRVSESDFDLLGDLDRVAALLSAILDRA
jgi:hypothetical protein